MNKSYKVKATKQRTQPSRTKVARPGLPVKGANLVAPRAESGKKSAKKTAAARQAARTGSGGAKKK